MSDGASPPAGQSTGFDVSIVSHGHGLPVLELVRVLATYNECRPAQVIITLNLPEPSLVEMLESGHWPFSLVIIRNTAQKGFGANHNAAFRKCGQDRFCIVNPDVMLPANPFPELLRAVGQAGAGCAYPRQIGANGELQDFAREVPTPLALWRRYAGRGGKTSNAVEWVTGAFMMFDATAYRAIGGFDERYFMYCEDVDICIRIQLAGYRLVEAKVDVIHVGQRASHASLRHLAWHLASLTRLWTSEPLRRFNRMRKNL